MDLDDRAAHAADALRRQVEPSLDIARARASVKASVGSRRDRMRRRARAGATALAVVAIVGVVAVAGGAGGGGGFLTTDGGDGDGGARSAAILGAMPSSPIDGKASWRLPVLAEPQSGLQDGDTVTIYGRGFGANEYIGIVQCTSEADTAEAGVSACQLAEEPDPEISKQEGEDVVDSYGAVTYADASAEGNVVADFVVRRYVTTPADGKVDCYSAAERCLVGMGAISNLDQSGGAYIDFADAPPFPEPVATLRPAGPYAPGQMVTADFTALVPGRKHRVQQCIEERCQNLVDVDADVTGAATVSVVLQPSFVDAATGDEIACGDRCVFRVNGIGAKGQSFAPFPEPLDLRFTSGQPSGPLIPTTTVPATTEAVAPTTAPPATVEITPTPPPSGPVAPESPASTGTVPASIPLPPPLTTEPDPATTTSPSATAPEPILPD